MIGIIISGRKISEKKIGEVECAKCAKKFMRKETHYQEVLILESPSRLSINESKQIVVGLPFELDNLFVKNKCPFCGFHNQEQEGDIFYEQDN